MDRIIVSPKYKQAYQAKFSDKIAEAKPELFKKLFINIFLLLGIPKSKYPDNEEQMVLIKFLMSNFGKWHINEIFHAVEHDVFSKQTKHFNSLTTTYLATILNFYNDEIRLPLNIEISQKIKKEEVYKELTGKIYTVQYMIDKCIETGILKWKNDYNYYGAEGINKMYEYLENIGEINLSNSEKEEIQNIVKSRTLDAEKQKKLENRRYVVNMENIDLKTMCRKHVLKSYFDKKIKDKNA